MGSGDKDHHAGGTPLPSRDRGGNDPTRPTAAADQPVSVTRRRLEPDTTRTGKSLHLHASFLRRRRCKLCADEV